MLFSLALLPFSSPILSSPFQFSSLDSVIFGLIGRKKLAFWPGCNFRGIGRKCFTDLERSMLVLTQCVSRSPAWRFCSVTDKLQRAHVINYNQELIL